MKRSTMVVSVLGAAAVAIMAFPVVQNATRPQPLTAQQMDRMIRTVSTTYDHTFPLPHTYLATVVASGDRRAIVIEYVVTNAIYPQGNPRIPGPSPDQVAHILNRTWPTVHFMVSRADQFLPIRLLPSVGMRAISSVQRG